MQQQMQCNNKSNVDLLIEKQKQADEKEKKFVEEMKVCCQDIFSSPNGKFFLKYLKKLSFWSEQDINVNHDVLIYKKGRRDVWAIIRNVIPKDVLAQIEIYDEVDLTE